MHRRNWRVISVMVALTLLLQAPVRAFDKQSGSIDVNGVTRTCIVAEPSAAAGGPRPLVLLLHGHLGTAANVMGHGFRPSPLSAWLDRVDSQNVIVVALQGLKGGDGRTGWNDCRADNARNPTADDVAFADAIVKQLIDRGAADAHRVYVMGMSNGGFMTLRLAQQMQPLPAAVAAMSASMAVDSRCDGPQAPVSVLLIDGTEDPLVPYAGGEVVRQGGKVLGVAGTRDVWLRADGLVGTAPVTRTLPHLHRDDPTRVEVATYGADAGPQVEVVTIDGGGHVEPSLQHHYGAIYRRIVGAQNRDFESAALAWAFFAPKRR
ncbi:MAG: prolyl oligopeptidase family serine peptidase [Gammaproteobacteria bacterium]|nr:prolyl oligopeptidase family serine peptidase [Gammaproteobacteria bacterium]